MALFNALHTDFTSQQQIDEYANNLSYLSIKAVKNVSTEKKSATHRQTVNYSNVMSSVISMNVVNADSATSSEFNSYDDNGSTVATLSDTVNAQNGIRSLDRCYQYNENTSTAVYNLDRSKYSDLSQLGNIIYSGIFTNAATHQHSLSLYSTSSLMGYSNTVQTVSGRKSGKNYTYELIGGGFSAGTPSAWNTTSGIVNTEH